jgi:NAD(P)-dependent dehydrogenase (short-subunit alcohol dehydrogenase family)
MTLLSNKTAIITGASSGIGRAAAKLFAQEGASVVVAARRAAELEALASEIRSEGGAAIALAGDVSREDFAKNLVDAAEESFGGLDIAFNNAGIMGQLCDITAMSLANWSRTHEVNLTGAFLCAKHQIPAMLRRGKGSLIFTSTFVGHTAGFPGTVAYAASKSGLIGMTKVLAAEYGPKGIRVNALLPGGTDTPMARAMNAAPEMITFVEGIHALKRLASPDEIARSALFLASDAASFVTGTAMLVDGGVSINKT